MQFATHFLAVAVTFLVLTACGTAPPKCSDENVKSTVMEISTNEIKAQLFPQTILQFLHENSGKGQLSDTDYPEDLLIKFWRQNYYADYNEWEQHRNSKYGVELIFFEFEKQMADISPHLSAIRTTSEDKKTKKCSCAAELSFSNGKKVDIIYNAQITDENDLYVEVFGLR